jgi:hypothetical protein
VIRHVGQPNHFWLIRQDAHRPEAQLIGFLQELVQLTNLALDDITHNEHPP